MKYINNPNDFPKIEGCIDELWELVYLALSQCEQAEKHYDDLMTINVLTVDHKDNLDFLKKRTQEYRKLLDTLDKEMYS